MGSTQKQYKPHVDFDEMLALAKTDPATFEAKRTEYIESFLTSVPAEKQARLRGLQWQIDQTRQLARTPMASCIAISSMMWDSLRQLGNQQRELVELSIRQTPQFASTKKSAPAAKGTIIPFPARCPPFEKSTTKKPAPRFNEGAGLLPEALLLSVKNSLR